MTQDRWKMLAIEKVVEQHIGQLEMIVIGVDYESRVQIGYVAICSKGKNNNSFVVFYIELSCCYVYLVVLLVIVYSCALLSSCVYKMLFVSTVG